MIPAELQTLPQWVVAGRNKVPLNPKNLHSASVTDSRTWSTYTKAVEVAKQNTLEIGFVFTAEDPYVGIDLDVPVNDIEKARHKKIYQEIVTYTETSISGKGYHLIAKATIPHAARRDHVEIYSKERYFIMTGKAVRGRPKTIEDCNGIISQLVKEMSGTNKYNLLHSEPERDIDEIVLQRCKASANSGKFIPLWEGRWEGAYQSQSEADYALINMLAFVSPNNDQCKRLFRLSGLGQRTKAQREDYIDVMLGQIRGEQNPLIDFSNFQPPVIKHAIALPIPCNFPEGLVGEMAAYILDTAIRPVPQVALAGALGLMAGIAGRAYNINHMGLNLYLMLVAGTAIGKEGAAQGIMRLVKATAAKLPAVYQFIGPTEYASGQALIKQFQTNPCQLSILAEFGYTLKRICRADATGADIMWRKVLLDIFNKSGHSDVLGSMVYSDAGKNTPIIMAPALTLLTESTPASLYEGLDEHAIDTGLVPRFLLLECSDTRPPINPQAFTPPPGSLTAQLEALAHRCLSMQANNTYQPVGLTAKAQKLLDAFDLEVDAHINAQIDDGVRQIWSRAHMKALRLAGLITVGLNMNKPIVDVPAAQWAINLVRVDACNMLKQFGEGVGSGDPVQLTKLRQTILNAIKASALPKMKRYGVVTHRQMAQRAYALISFRQDKRGAGEALRRAIQALLDGGEIVQLSAHDTREQFKTTAKCYMVTSDFKQD